MPANYLPIPPASVVLPWLAENCRQDKPPVVEWDEDCDFVEWVLFDNEEDNLAFTAWCVEYASDEEAGA